MSDPRLKRDVQYVASTHFTHVDSVTGETLSWHQEDEDSITSRENGLAVLQRMN